jgi:hypothetical protein
VGACEPALFHIDLGEFFAACGMGPQSKGGLTHLSVCY